MIITFLLLMLLSFYAQQRIMKAKGEAMSRWKIFAGLALFVGMPAQSFAVNFYDGARAPEGLYFLTYSSLYYADSATDYKGNASKKDYDYRKIEEVARFCYYTPDLVITALIPVGEAHSGLYDSSSRGIGDVNLGIGHFLPIKKLDILPALFVKLPTGDYDSTKLVNYGSHQYDIKPTIFLYKAFDRASIDAAAKYYFRTKNSSTGVTAGDELYLQLLLGWQCSKKCKAGPSLNWTKSAKQKNQGTTVSRSARESFSMGGDVYLRFSRVSVTLTYLRDVYSENTTKGDFFQVKTCYKF